MLAIYEGQNNGLRVQINEFEHAFKLLFKARDAIKKKVISNIEQRLIVIIELGINGNAYDKKWLAASRIEIHALLENFESIRATLGIQITNQTYCSHMQNLKEKFSNPIFDTDEIRSASRAAANRFYGSAATGICTATISSVGAVGAVTGGPIVAGSSAAATALFAFPAAVIVTKSKVNQAEKDAVKNAEDALRKCFKYSV